MRASAGLINRSLRRLSIMHETQPVMLPPRRGVMLSRVSGLFQRMHSPIERSEDIAKRPTQEQPYIGVKLAFEAHTLCRLINLAFSKIY